MLLLSITVERYVSPMLGALTGGIEQTTRDRASAPRRRRRLVRYPRPKDLEERRLSFSSTL